MHNLPVKNDLNPFLTKIVTSVYRSLCHVHLSANDASRCCHPVSYTHLGCIISNSRFISSLSSSAYFFKSSYSDSLPPLLFFTLTTAIPVSYTHLWWDHSSFLRNWKNGLYWWSQWTAWWKRSQGQDVYKRQIQRS